MCNMKAQSLYWIKLKMYNHKTSIGLNGHRSFSWCLHSKNLIIGHWSTFKNIWLFAGLGKEIKEQWGNFSPPVRKISSLFPRFEIIQDFVSVNIHNNVQNMESPEQWIFWPFAPPLPRVVKTGLHNTLKSLNRSCSCS